MESFKCYVPLIVENIIQLKKPSLLKSSIDNFVTTRCDNENFYEKL